MQRVVFVVLLVLAMPMQAMAQTKLEAQFKKRADEFKDKGLADYGKMVTAYDGMFDRLNEVALQINDIDARYKKVKNLFGAADQEAIEKWLSKSLKVWATNDALRKAGGSYAKKRTQAENLKNSADGSYKNSQWQAAATEYGSLTATSVPFKKSIDATVTDLNTTLLTGEAVSKLIKSKEE